MYDYGTTPEQVAAVKVAHSKHASNNPKAFYKQRYTIEDVVSSRIICKPLHLLDCCVETDNATCVIVTRTERARDCPNPPAVIQSVVGRCCKPRADMHYQHGPISTVAGHYAKDILWSNAGLGLARTSYYVSTFCESPHSTTMGGFSGTVMANWIIMCSIAIALSLITTEFISTSLLTASYGFRTWPTTSR